MNEKVLKVTCPTCKKASLFQPKNPYRPFCSERCKLIDLGAWANEDYQIPSNEIPNDETSINEDDGD